jgi:hypothetical protein
MPPDKDLPEANQSAGKFAVRVSASGVAFLEGLNRTVEMVIELYSPMEATTTKIAKKQKTLLTELLKDFDGDVEDLVGDGLDCHN